MCSSYLSGTRKKIGAWQDEPTEFWHKPYNPGNNAGMLTCLALSEVQYALCALYHALQLYYSWDSIEENSPCAIEWLMIHSLF